MTHRWWTVGFGAGLLLSCGGPQQERTGYLFVVGQAEEPAIIDIAGWQTRSRLPFAIPAGKPVTVAGTAVEIVAGQVSLFHADTAREEELALGRDLKSDTLLVRGEPEAVTELAARLSATATEGTDGAFALTAKDIFERASYLDAPEQLKEVLPERVVRTAGQAVNAAGPLDSLFGRNALEALGVQTQALGGLRAITFAAQARSAAEQIVQAAIATTRTLDARDVAADDDDGSRVRIRAGFTFYSCDQDPTGRRALVIREGGRYTFRMRGGEFSGPYKVVRNELRLVPEASADDLEVPRYFRLRMEAGNALRDRDTGERLLHVGVCERPAGAGEIGNDELSDDDILWDVSN